MTSWSNPFSVIFRKWPCDLTLFLWNSGSHLSLWSDSIFRKMQEVTLPCDLITCSMKFSKSPYIVIYSHFLYNWGRYLTWWLIPFSVKLRKSPYHVIRFPTSCFHSDCPFSPTSTSVHMNNSFFTCSSPFLLGMQWQQLSLAGNFLTQFFVFILHCIVILRSSPLLIQLEHCECVLHVSL